MDDVIDINERKRRKKPPDDIGEDGRWFCECGCGMFRLWTDGTIECLNCAGIVASLKVSEAH